MAGVSGEVVHELPYFARLAFYDLHKLSFAVQKQAAQLVLSVVSPSSLDELYDVMRPKIVLCLADVQDLSEG